MFKKEAITKVFYIALFEARSALPYYDNTDTGCKKRKEHIRKRLVGVLFF